MQIETALSFCDRYIGLMGRGSIPNDFALYIGKCRQVHTWFMRFAIDVVFVDDNGVVLDVCENVMPWSVTRRVGGAAGCLELAAGEASARKIAIGKKCIIDEY